MKLFSNSFEHNGTIPAKLAFCRIDLEIHASLSDNINPHLGWVDAPEGTRSFALICHDPDVPSKGDDVNQEGKSIPASLPRVDFYHWLLTDISAETSEITEGAFSDGITPRGKPGSEAAEGTRQGINNYTDWFAGDEEMQGLYHGYDGPCPPWNDAIPHHYIFTLYALDVEKLDLNDHFNGVEMIAAMEGHILDQASITGVYTLNPDLAE